MGKIGATAVPNRRELRLYAAGEKIEKSLMPISAVKSRLVGNRKHGY